MGFVFLSELDLEWLKEARLSMTPHLLYCSVSKDPLHNMYKDLDPLRMVETEATRWFRQ